MPAGALACAGQRHGARCGGLAAPLDFGEESVRPHVSLFR
jgi:hypothetical protein